MIIIQYLTLCIALRPGVDPAKNLTYAQDGLDGGLLWDHALFIMGNALFPIKHDLRFHSFITEFLRVNSFRTDALLESREYNQTPYFIFQTYKICTIFRFFSKSKSSLFLNTIGAKVTELEILYFTQLK